MFKNLLVFKEFYSVTITYFQDKKKEAIKDCTSAIDLDSTYLKAILRRATLNEETEQLDEALKDFQHVLELDASHAEAQRAVRVIIFNFFILDSLCVCVYTL